MTANASAANKEVIRTLYEACLNKRAYELLPTLVSTDYAGPQGERGPEGMAATIKPLIAAFPDMRWTIDDLLADGEKVVVRWIWHGTQSADFRGFPNSGNAVTNHAIAIYELRKGKIIGVHMESDRLGFFTQIGVVPQALVTPPAGKK